MKIDELIKRLKKLQSNGATDGSGNDIDFSFYADELENTDEGRCCYVEISCVLLGGDADYLMGE